MKIVQQEHTITRSEGMRNSSFSMANTAAAFEILSSGLYSDKPLAIIRELACNARDAHVAAGNKDLPIRVVLPNRFDTTLIIEDFGTGLSDHDVRGGWEHENGTRMSFIEADEHGYTDDYLIEEGWIKTTGVYNTYFKSTKTASDEFIGQLGLGSKSPFSYANNFLVEVRHGTTHNVYSCYKDNTRCPAIALLSTEPKEATDTNGIKISIPIDINDCELFVQAARQALVYFTPHPVVLMGETPYEIDFCNYPADRTWNWRDTTKIRVSGVHVVQGSVRYPVDFSILENSGLPHIDSAIGKCDIDIIVDIGRVTSAASREALQYDDHTIDNLLDIIRKVRIDLREQMAAEYNDCTTPYSIALKHHNLSTLVNSKGITYRAFHQIQPFTIDDKPVTSDIIAGWWHQDTMECFAYNHDPRRAFKRHSVFTAKDDGELVGKINVDDKLMFLFVAKHRGAQGMIRRWADTKQRYTRVMVFQVKSAADIEGCRQNVKDYCEMYGFPFEELDLIEFAATPKSSSNRTRGDRDPETEYYTWNQFVRSSRSYASGRLKYSRQCWNLESIADVDPVEGLMYVPISNFAVVDSRIGTSIDAMIKEAIAMNAPIDDTIFGLTKVDVERLTKQGVKLTLMYDVLREFVEERVKRADITTPANSVTDIYGIVDKTILDTIQKGAKTDSEILTREGPIGGLMKIYRDAERIEQNKTRAVVINLARRLDIDVATQTSLGAIQSLWEEVIKEYQLLPHMRWFDSSGIAHYINLVNTKIQMEKNAC